MSDGKIEAPEKMPRPEKGNLRNIKEILDEYRGPKDQTPVRDSADNAHSVQPRPGWPLLATVDGLATEDFQRVRMVCGVPVALVKGFK